MKTIRIGVLAFHGDVIEHVKATRSAIQNLRAPVEVTEVRTKDDIRSIGALIIPGGESTTIYKLAKREDILTDVTKIPFMFGTCAGAILISKTILHKTDDQEPLEKIDITIDRNAYGRQTDSFEVPLNTALGTIQAVFIRAPKIVSAGPTVRTLAQKNGEILACETKTSGSHVIAACFHPELTTTIFHEYFIRSIMNSAQHTRR